jgi:hypothetical protein
MENARAKSMAADRWGSQTLVYLLVAALLVGCASSTPQAGGPLAGESSPNAGGAASATAYKLTKEELAFDCHKLTGRMRLRILQVKNSADRPATSEIGRTMQSAATPIFGGSRRGIDPAAEINRDRAMLHAYNQRLADKKCKTIDLDKELAAKSG